MSNKLVSVVLATGLVLPLAGPAAAVNRNGYQLSVLVDGRARREYRSHGRTYVEALRGREYTLRLRNPFPRRVAVALSVDGLNTIDARHTRPSEARKWVLAPYETVEIEGWQVSQSQARSFYFTGERDSYGAWLGKTEDLGVIEAVFFRERRPAPPVARIHEGEAKRRSPRPSTPAEARPVKRSRPPTRRTTT